MQVKCERAAELLAAKLPQGAEVPELGDMMRKMQQQIGGGSSLLKSSSYFTRPANAGFQAFGSCF